VVRFLSAHHAIGSPAGSSTTKLRESRGLAAREAREQRSERSVGDSRDPPTPPIANAMPQRRRTLLGYAGTDPYQNPFVRERSRAPRPGMRLMLFQQGQRLVAVIVFLARGAVPSRASHGDELRCGRGVRQGTHRVADGNVPPRIEFRHARCQCHDRRPDRGAQPRPGGDDRVRGPSPR
jgi:hypothetical protein